MLRSELRCECFAEVLENRERQTPCALQLSPKDYLCHKRLIFGVYWPETQCVAARREPCCGSGSGRGGGREERTQPGWSRAPGRSTHCLAAGAGKHSAPSPGGWELPWCASVRCKMNELLFSGCSAPVAEVQTRGCIKCSAPSDA